MASVWLIVLIGLLLVTAPATWSRISLPVRIIALGFGAFGLLGSFAFHPDVTLLQADYVPIRFYESLRPLYIVTVFFGIALCIIIGANLARIVLPGTRMVAGSSSSRLALELPSGVLIFGMALVFGHVLGVGPGSLFYAPAYLATSGSDALLKISDALLPLAVVAAAACGFRPGQSRGVRLLAIVLLVVIEVLFLGRASRSSAVFFGYVFAGVWLTGRWSKRATVVAAMITLVVTLVFLGIPLELRTGPQFGIVPSLTYLFTDPVRFVGGTYSPQNNVLLGVPLSLYVGRFLPAIPIHTFWVDVNPLPSGFTDWAEVSPGLKVIPTQPYPAIGELLNYGIAYLVAFFTLLGGVFETLVWIARHARGQISGALQSAIAGLSGVLVIRATEYQLRTQCRFVYYLLVLVVVGTVASRFLYARPAVLRILGPEAQREVAEAEAATSPDAAAGTPWAAAPPPGAGGKIRGALKPTKSARPPHAGRRRIPVSTLPASRLPIAVRQAPTTAPVPHATASPGPLIAPR